MEHPTSAPRQRFSPSPSPEYAYDAAARHVSHALDMASVNGRSSPFNGSLSRQASVYDSPVALSPPLSTAALPSPPQTLRARKNQHRMQQARRHPNINPIYLNPQFRQYREKQNQRRGDDPREQKWPAVLEDAFLDALLLIPNMGRQKYSMRGGLHGRNMLILEYLWISYCKSLKPGEAPDESFRRTRKQVSSHIQVLKNFYKSSKYYHFLFGAEENEKVEKHDRRGSKRRDLEDEETSLKNNTVLKAIAEGRLPVERPDYEYFARLLMADAQVAVRPKLAWIYVASPEQGDFHGSLSNESAGRRHGSASSSTSELCAPMSGNLLHEYTQTLEQRDCASTAVREIAREWAVDIPSLHKELLGCTTTDENCDILDMTATLELPSGGFSFPVGAQLRFQVELGVELAHLQGMRWRCRTRIARPAELCDVNQGTVYEALNDVVFAQRQGHVVGCRAAANSSCDCASKAAQQQQQQQQPTAPAPAQRDRLRLPFPAREWASILSGLMEYRDGPSAHQPKRHGRTRSKGESDFSDSTCMASDLLDQVAMLQELSFCSPQNAHDERAWTRRAVVLWRFQLASETHENAAAQQGAKASKRTCSGAPPAEASLSGTQWRFLTVADPLSQEHQEKAYLGRPKIIAPKLSSSSLRSLALSHSPFGDATMTDVFTAGWDIAGASSSANRSYTSAASTSSASQPFDLLDALSSGLVTPPPTASIHSSFSSYCDGGTDYLSAVRPMPDPFLSVSAAEGSICSGMYDSGSDYDYDYDCVADPSLNSWSLESLDGYRPPSVSPPTSTTLNGWSVPMVPDEAQTAQGLPPPAWIAPNASTSTDTTGGRELWTINAWPGMGAMMDAKLETSGGATGWQDEDLISPCTVLGFMGQPTTSSDMMIDEALRTVTPEHLLKSHGPLHGASKGMKRERTDSLDVGEGLRALKRSIGDC